MHPQWCLECKILCNSFLLLLKEVHSFSSSNPVRFPGYSITVCLVLLSPRSSQETRFPTRLSKAGGAHLCVKKLALRSSGGCQVLREEIWLAAAVKGVFLLLLIRILQGWILLCPKVNLGY